MNLTSNQKKTLNLLLDKYERSKTCEGTNRVTQTFSVIPTAIWEEYTSDFAEVEQVKDFEADMAGLEKQGILTVKRKDGEIRKIIACKERIPEYYDILRRKPKKDALQEQLAFYRGWSEKGNKWIASYCQEQIERISSGRNAAYSLDIAENIIRLLDYLFFNKKELLERELSMIVLSDSKQFETRYRTKLCKLLCTYINFDDKLEGIDNSREREKIILEEFNIYVNPSYIYLKGKAKIGLKSGEQMVIGEAPIALSSEVIREITFITVESLRIVTVENLTSFHRVNVSDNTYIYLAGYHNTEKQTFIKRIAEENPGKEWFHFGDIDPDGFYILEHLKQGTGLDITPLLMGNEELEMYKKYCKPLNENDMVKANNLVQKGCYVNVLQYMLQHNCKLEQEIVSLYCR